MRPDDVRADPWDRLRLALTWGLGALLPVWIVVFATFAQLAQSRAEAEAQTIDLGQGIVVVVGESGPSPLAQAFVAATGLVLAVAVVGAAAAWVVAGRSAPRRVEPLDATLYAADAVWTVRRRRDDGATPPDQSQADSTG